MTRINIEINDELHKKAKLYSVLHTKTLIEYITDAIREKVEKDEKNEKKGKWVQNLKQWIN